MHAVVSTTVSPYRATIAPLACLAIFPVSRMSGRPPTSTVTRCDAGEFVFSDIKSFPLAQHLCVSVVAARSRSEGLKCLRRAKGQQRTMSLLLFRKKRGENQKRTNKRDGLHHEKLRH